ncbi:5789_t:CDS:2, partial [Acaulospora morrowiae]
MNETEEITPEINSEKITPEINSEKITPEIGYEKAILSEKNIVLPPSYSSSSIQNPHNNKDISSVFCSPDLRHVATASLKDRSVCTWEIQKGKDGEPILHKVDLLKFDNISLREPIRISNFKNILIGKCKKNSLKLKINVEKNTENFNNTEMKSWQSSREIQPIGRCTISRDRVLILLDVPFVIMQWNLLTRELEAQYELDWSLASWEYISMELNYDAKCLAVAGNLKETTESKVYFYSTKSRTMVKDVLFEENFANISDSSDKSNMKFIALAGKEYLFVYFVQNESYVINLGTFLKSKIPLFDFTDGKDFIISGRYHSQTIPPDDPLPLCDVDSYIIRSKRIKKPDDKQKPMYIQQPMDVQQPKQHIQPDDIIEIQRLSLKLADKTLSEFKEENESNQQSNGKEIKGIVENYWKKRKSIKELELPNVEPANIEGQQKDQNGEPGQELADLQGLKYKWVVRGWKEGNETFIAELTAKEKGAQIGKVDVCLRAIVYRKLVASQASTVSSNFPIIGPIIGPSIGPSTGPSIGPISPTDSSQDTREFDHQYLKDTYSKENIYKGELLRGIIQAKDVEQ